MGNKSLTMEFRAIDKMTLPVKGMAGASRTLTTELRMIQRESRGAERDLNMLAKAARSAQGSFTELNSALGVAHKAVGAAEAVGELVYDLGRGAVEAASFKEASLISFEAVTGSATEAATAFSDMVDLVAELPMHLREAGALATQLAQAGFNRKELFPLTVASSDVEATTGASGRDRFIAQIEAVKELGASEKALKGLAKTLLVPEEAILGNLGKMYGGATSQALLKGMKAGQVQGNDLINAALQAFAKKQGGALGNFSVKKAGTVEGLFDRLGTRKEQLLMDLDMSPGYASFRGFLSNLNGALDPNSPFGAKAKADIATVFGGTFTRIFGDFSGPNGAAQMEVALTKALRVVDLMGVGIESAVGFAKGFAVELAKGAGVTGDLWGPGGKLDPKKVGELVKGFEKMGHEIGQAAGDFKSFAVNVHEIMAALGMVKDKDGKTDWGGKSHGIPGVAEVKTDAYGIPHELNIGPEFHPFDAFERMMKSGYRMANKYAPPDEISPAERRELGLPPVDEAAGPSVPVVPPSGRDPRAAAQAQGAASRSTHNQVAVTVNFASPGNADHAAQGQIASRVKQVVEDAINSTHNRSTQD